LSGGEVAGLIVATFWAILVCFLAYVLVRLGTTLKETTKFIAGVSDRTVPILSEVTTTVMATNVQLSRVDAITANVATMTGNATALTSVFAAILGNPMIRVAAFTYAVRRALGERGHREIERRVRAEIQAGRAWRRQGQRRGRGRRARA
jgi:uncharacterized protein YoxC